jgi:hypothetical protein
MAAEFQALLDWLRDNNQAVTAMAAVFVAAVTAIYAFVTILLWLATRRQAILTRQMFEASHTPYVSIRVEDATDTSIPGRLSFNMVLENHGPVLAHIMNWEVRATLTDMELQVRPVPHIAAVLSPFDRTLTPGQRRVIQPIFYDDRLPNTDLRFDFVAMVAYRGSGSSISVTDFEAMGQSGSWRTQDCRMRRPEDIFWAALGYKNYM